MEEQVNRLRILTLLNETRKNLKLLKHVDIEKIPFADIRELAHTLKVAYASGYEKLEAEESAYFNKEYVERFLMIEGLNQNGNFDTFLKLTGLEKVNQFEPIAESLAAQRLQLQEMIKQEINIEGFPLSIIPSKLNTIVAASHVGKTFYATALSLSLAREGSKVLFISTEEDKLAFIERTYNIKENDEAFKNLTLLDQHTFNKEKLYSLMRKAEEEEYDFVFFDYLKKSMWDNYTSDAVVMEEMISTILKAIQDMDRKLSVFTFAQANREANNKYNNVEEFSNALHDAPKMIDGGMPPFRSAENLIFLYQDPSTAKRHMIVSKARSRNHNKRGKVFEYNIDPTNLTIELKDEELFNFTQPGKVKTKKQSNEGW